MTWETPGRTALKTPSGRRSLALDPATLEALGAHQRRQAQERAVIELADANDLGR